MDSISTAQELTAAGDLVLYDQLGAAQVDDKFPVFTPMAVSVQGSVNPEEDSSSSHRSCKIPHLYTNK